MHHATAEAPTIGAKLVNTHGPFQDDEWEVVDFYAQGRTNIVRLEWMGSTLDVVYTKHFWFNWRTV